MSKLFSKTEVNFLLDFALLIAFVFLCWTSAVVRFVFPPGPRAEGWTLWGWGYDEWAALQFGAVCALAAGVTLHVMLHWGWVCGVIAAKLRKRKSAGASGPQDSGSRTLWGVGLLIVVLNLLGAGLAAAVLAVKSP